MDIYIARGEERKGPYSMERVRSLLSRGLLEGNELAWHEGRTGWTAIREILNNLPAPVQQPKPPGQQMPPQQAPTPTPVPKASRTTQVPSGQPREETVTQKAPKTSQDKWDLILLPYFAFFCLAIVIGLAGLVIYLIWSAIRPA